MEDTNTNTKQSKAEVVKPFNVKAILRKLSPKQRKWIKYYMETGNQTKSAKLAGYSERSASLQGYRMMKNEKVLMVLNDAVEEAEMVIRGIMNDETAKQETQLAAAREVLDRTIGKPIQRSESVNVNITVESMLDTPA